MDKDEELLQDIDTEQMLERLDRKLRIRKGLIVSLFAVLLAFLVLYAVRIERKIADLSEKTQIVIYKDASSEPSDNDTTQISAQESTTETDISETFTVAEGIIDNDFTAGSEENNVTDVSVSVIKETSASAENVSSVYYVTKTGKKYHKGGCAYLSKSQIAISYDEIVEKGYKPCSKCIS